MHLKKLRRKKKIMQQDMANSLGVSLKQFQRYEQGINIPPFDKAILWAKELKLTLNQFKALYINKEVK